VPRDLSWDGYVNVRDLGGFQTPAGTTVFGVFVRADIGFAEKHRTLCREALELDAPRFGEAFGALGVEQPRPILSADAMEDDPAIGARSVCERTIVRPAATAEHPVTSSTG
jgi:hypothetical protein